MDIVFLCGVFEKNKISEIMKKSKTAIQFAADALQWNLIEGLDYWNENPIKIINAPFVGSFPKHYKDFYVKKSKWHHIPSAKDFNIGFLNIFGIKNIFRALGMAKETRKWARDYNNNKKILMAYSINMPFLWAMYQAKKTNTKITTCLIVPDLPEYMNMCSNSSIIYFIAKKIDIILINKLIKHVDTFVLLTEQMAGALEIKEKSYCVVEGMVNSKILDTQNLTENYERKSILYTGTLNYKYGIELLLDAFKLIKDTSIELWICGYGEAERDINNLAIEDKRIKWFGSVSREHALNLQQKATVLINPRPLGEEFTNYSFPSKNLEYLASGRPVIAYKLPGIPDEYDQYFYYINGKKPSDMADVIMEVFEKRQYELDSFGQNARDFVLKYKNNIIQTKRIVEMISKSLLVKQASSHVN